MQKSANSAQGSSGINPGFYIFFNIEYHLFLNALIGILYNIFLALAFTLQKKLTLIKKVVCLLNCFYIIQTYFIKNIDCHKIKKGYGITCLEIYIGMLTKNSMAGPVSFNLYTGRLLIIWTIKNSINFAMNRWI